MGPVELTGPNLKKKYLVTGVAQKGRRHVDNSGANQGAKGEGALLKVLKEVAAESRRRNEAISITKVLVPSGKHGRGMRATWNRERAA